QPYNDVRRPVIRAPKAERGGETVLEARDLSGGYGPEKILFENVELRIARGERIGVVGKNGAGKTTLLKIIAGKMAPLGGALVFVSHDREFLDGLCNQILEVADGAVRRYEGNYSAWRNAKAAEAAARGVAKEAAQDAAKVAARARAAKATASAPIKSASNP